MRLLPTLPSPTRLCTVIGLSLLAACARQPTPDPTFAGSLPNPLTYTSASISQQPLPERWWQLLRDPQLDRWVEQALANNQDLAQAKANVQAMLAGMGERQAQRLPATSLNLAATYGKSTDDQTLAEATHTHAAAQWQFSPGVELAYQVDAWGQVRAAIERASAHAQANAAAHDLLRLQVVAQTTRAYVQQCVYQARIAAAHQALSTLDNSLWLSDRQRQAGAATALDSERLLSLRDQVRARLPVLEAGRDIAQFELSMLGGQATVQPQPPCTAIPRLTGPLPAGDGWHLLARRPDVRQAERELQAASLQTQIAKADLYPKVSFGAQLSASDHRLGNVGGSRAITFGIGPLIHWEFPNLKANRARLSKAQALQQAQVAHYQSVALGALKDVRQALARHDATQQRLQALASALAHSQRGYDLARSNHRAGTVDGLALLDSERELIRLQDRNIAAQGSVASAQIELFRALGGGW
ncbi:TolC family protein [Pseudomonas parafulva]|uniref:TolC family protein n=1 Tax=Pseudomonas parafulva TaxID=157782 RepID=UPI000423FB87|nr:TolC family protein [Pseudomonas parafulva]